MSSVSVIEALDEVNYSILVGLSTHIQKDDELRLQVPTKALEKPEMRREFGAVEMLKTRKYFEFSVEGLSFELGFKFSFRVRHAWVPEILVEQGDILFYGGREISVIGHLGRHPFFIEVFYFLQNNVDPLLQVTPRLAVKPV